MLKLKHNIISERIHLGHHAEGPQPALGKSGFPQKTAQEAEVK